jgi:hypothetical protein
MICVACKDAPGTELLYDENVVYSLCAYCKEIVDGVPDPALEAPA